VRAPCSERNPIVIYDHRYYLFLNLKYKFIRDLWKKINFPKW
jgi:hypothetical protein